MNTNEILNDKRKAIVSTSKLKMFGWIAAVLAGSTFILHKRHSRVRFQDKDFDMEEITRGRIEKSIVSSGTINPIDIVNVGSQVSGTLEKVYVDFNDTVIKGQKLAKLETDVLERELKMHLSNLRQTKSQLQLIEMEAQHMRDLYKNNYVAKIELDKTENKLVEATENHKMAQLNYEKARIQLNQAYIKSPVGGIVISRDMDEGQIVAANYSAPTLFRIAKDLRRMHIETGILEADIGMIKPGLKVTFTVDAFRDKVFNGVVQQIRLHPIYEQNVVVYNTIVTINNDDKLLLPGMTAFVTITVKAAENTLKLPSVALRFKPSKEVRRILGIPELSKQEKERLAEKLKENDNVYIFVVRNGKPKGLLVKKGINDLTHTEIKSNELQVGDKVIVSYVAQKNKK